MNVDEWAEIRRCHAAGESIKGIAARMRMSRNTVRRALTMPDPPTDHRRRRGSVADDADREIRDLLAREPAITIAEIGRRIDWQHSRTLLARKVREIRGESTPRPAGGAAVPTGLPQQATGFVGRHAELVELRRLLGESWLVTMVGPGGIGKSRMAIAAAEEFRRAFPDGVRFVEFAAVRNEELLAQTVCDALGLETRSASDRTADESLVDYLRNRRMLLILDNCEHVINGTADLVGRLLEETSALRLLLTSRELLAMPGENVFALPPLPVAVADGTGAPELFARRAAAVLGNFELDDSNLAAVQRICEHLDGLPLAIELACTRLNVLSVDELADRLDRRLSVLAVTSRDRTPRHRSLQATIDWSYELCTPTEQLLWQRAAVFADGFDLALAEEVCTDAELAEAEIMDSVSALVAKSVLVRDPETVDGRARFRMLETIREYGWGRLPQAEQNRVSARLLESCAQLIIDSAADWYGPDQPAKAAAVEVNRGNVRAALHWAMTDDVPAETTAVAARALGAARYLWACGIAIREHRMWLIHALELPGADAATKARILAVLALVQNLQGDRDAADYSVRRARELAGDTDPVTAAFAEHMAGLRGFFAGEFVAARARLDEAEQRYRTLGGDPALLATLQVHRGMLLTVTGDIDGAEAAFTEVYRAGAAAGERWFQAYATHGLGVVALLRGDPVAAEGRAMEALSSHRDFGDIVGITLITDLLGWALAAGGAGRRAAVVLGAASAMWESVGHQLYGSEHWKALRDTAIEEALGQCGQRAFDAGWAEGEAMGSAGLIAYVFEEDDDEDTDADSPAEALSPREREVADLVAEGLTNREIAERLVLSPRTVEGHVERILHKLFLTRRTEVAAVLAMS